MSPFEFDPNLSPEQNIDLFFSHLNSFDADMAKILRDGLSIIHPLPEVATARTSARKAFNDGVQKELRKLVTTPKPT